LAQWPHGMALRRSGGHTFTHAHNLFVHWAVELGLPLMLLASGLLFCKRAAEALWKPNHCMSTIADRACRRTVCT